MSFDKEVSTEMKVLAQADKYREDKKNFKGFLIFGLLLIGIPVGAYLGYQRLDQQARSLKDVSGWANLPERIEGYLIAESSCIATSAPFSAKNPYLENIAIYSEPNRIAIGPGFIAGSVKVKRIDGKLVRSKKAKNGMLVFELTGITADNAFTKQRLAIPVSTDSQGHVKTCDHGKSLNEL